ncbi:polyribonucleotide nucleotidyltransferase [Helicobacter sp. 12S02232-10]|uniref:polyribonucleotide nucleotidyltransferase n=1 Tax=Helicobacter sp. 12S02232-10 TaxID=1476197 RepID=UPI000BA5DC90|nr:polyribonucleotide nucleotidyltransferase [Helicobacter sp. 12S02232-10]PAF46724.1 polyribonucleotide nucleotidyltransferase [Helicobacter sp. 12S02232-10]
MRVNVIELHLENLVEKYTLDFVAKQSAGALWYQNGGTVILASVAVDNKPVQEDFLPLTVQYIEKSYAVGKFPGGFIKREGKPGEFETLTSRIIDRSLRPIFPKGYAYPTQITIMVLSYDRKSDLQVCALNAAANALYVSNLPFSQAVCAIRVGKIQDRFVFNPTAEELTQSSLDLYVSGSNDDLLMIEMCSLGANAQTNEISEEDLLEGLDFAKRAISKACLEYEKAFSPHKKIPLEMEFDVSSKNPEIGVYVRENFSQEILVAIAQMAKSERNSGLKKIADYILKTFGESQGWDFKDILSALESHKKEMVRSQIIFQGIRSDGRGYEDIRPIDIQTNVLPFAHGSVLFTRGQTQALVASTIGSENDAQIQECLNSRGLAKEKFMFHYNFPGFSVGDASIISSPSRRELGHGNLAKRALETSIAEKTKTIRLVSEILESNGSSSMASVCGGSLALCASGIEVRTLIAGIAMGLVVEGDKYAVLSDINGLEDHDGDMDFKVAGSINGITAMQMDTKLKGVSFEILKECLYQAKKARKHILQIMQKARDEIVLNTDILPSMQIFNIHPGKIVEVIGQGGKVIKEIIDRFKVSIDLDRENGEVRISGNDHNGVMGAKHFILDLIEVQKTDLSKYEIGEIFEGEVKKVLDFGAFVGLPKGGDGLLHINRFGKGKDYDLKVHIHEGDRIKCQILGLNKGKIELDLIKE